MNAPPERQTPLAGGVRRESGQQRNPDPTAEPREVQGFTPGRNPRQPAPTWDRPRGSGAADLLDEALRPRRYRVVAIKSTGKRVTLLTTADRGDAERWIALNRPFAASCGARIVIEGGGA